MEDTLLEKKYNSLLYSLMVYIYHLNILCHVKYRKSKFTLLEINRNILYVPEWYKQNCSKNNLLEKIYNVLFYILLEYIHILNILCHVKYQNSKFTWIEKHINIIYLPKCWKQNCSNDNLYEKIYNALFYSVLVYIHQLNMLSHVKYPNSNFT